MQHLGRLAEKGLAVKLNRLVAEDDTVVALTEVTVGGETGTDADVFIVRDGKTVRVDGAPAVITGVVSPTFRGTLMAVELDGYVTLDDLGQYRAMERMPLVGHYRGHAVYSVPPPVPNGAQLVETLNILDNYQARPGASVRTDADYLHYLVEAWRVRDGGISAQAFLA